MAEVTAMRNDCLPYPVYGLPYVVAFPLLDADGDPISPSSPDSEISKNGDTFADCTNEAVEIATTSGICYLSLTGTELTTDVATVRIQSTGAKTTVLTLYPRKLVSIRAGTSASAGSSTSTIVLDGSASAVDDFYNGMICSAVIDSVTEVRMITDYVGSTQTATVVPDWNTAPDNNDTFTIYRPDGVQIQQANATQIAGTTQAVPGASDGILISGTNAGTTTLGALTITGDTTHTGATIHTGTVTMADGLAISRSTSDTTAVSITGNGTGSGIYVEAGATGVGVDVYGGGTSGRGLQVQTNDATGAPAVYFGSTSTGSLVTFAGEGGLNIYSAGTDPGLQITSENNFGAEIGSFGNNKAGIQLYGSEAGAGLHLIGGADGAALRLEGGSSSGAGIFLTTSADNGVLIQPTGGHGISVEGDGTDMHGVLIRGGTAGTSDGLKLVAGTGGIDFRSAVIQAIGTFTTTAAAAIPVSNAAVSNTETLGVIVSGTYANTATKDASYFILRPTGSGSGIDERLDFTLTSGQTPTQVTIYGRWVGATNNITDVYAYNWNTASFDKLTYNNTAMIHRTTDTGYQYALNAAHKDETAGTVTIRFVTTQTNTAYRLNLDSVIVSSVSDSAATPPVTSVDVASFAGAAVVLDGNNYPGVNLVDVAGTGQTTGDLAALSAAIKTKTDFLPSATAGASGGLFIAGTNAATTVTTSFTTTFTGNLTGNVGGSVASVTAKTGYSLANTGLDAIVVETLAEAQTVADLNARQALALILADSCVLSGVGTGTLLFKTPAGTTRKEGTVDGSGNRPTVEFTPPA